MKRNMEVRSTFLFEEAGMGGGLTIPTRISDKILGTPQRPIAVQEPEGIFKNEFAVATAMSKTIYATLDDQMRSIVAPYTSKRLSSKINKSLSMENGSLSMEKNQTELEGFEFNTKNKFSKNADIKFCIKQGAQKGHQIIHIPAFIPAKSLTIPEGATNFKFCSRLIILSDCQTETMGYNLIYGGENGKYAAYESPMLPVLRIQTQPITAQLTIPEMGYIRSSTSTMLLFAVKFYNYQKSKFSFISEGSLMKIAKVF